MSWKDTAEPVLTKMPSVQQPEGHVKFQEKLKWTGGILLLYFFLTNISLFGLQTGPQGDLYGQFRTLLAGAQGSILTLGIGPIVTASIVLQLLSGADVLGIDKSDPRDQVLYQGLQKLLVIAMIFLTGIPMLFGFLQPSAALGQSLGIGTMGVRALLFAQLAVGGILILFMDEIISKWGVGSGIGLFIIAGVSQKLLGGVLAFRPITPTNGIIATWVHILFGNIEIGSILTMEGIQTLLTGQGQILGLITTLLIFGVVVYAESVRVEIPLKNARVSSARGRYPIKLIYASVLPMILVRAVQANIQFIGRILNRAVGVPKFIADYGPNGQPVSGLLYYLNPIYSPDAWMWWAGTVTQEWWQVMLRVGIDITFMVVGGAVFAIFWVETTGMGPKETAKNLSQSGMEMPGFRRNAGVMEQVLNRYIPQVTVLGGAIVGFLAVMANMLGTIGGVSGTGLLLTVSITYKIYEEIAEEKLMEMHPMMREMFDS